VSIAAVLQEVVSIVLKAMIFWGGEMESTGIVKDRCCINLRAVKELQSERSFRTSRSSFTLHLEI